MMTLVQKLDELKKMPILKVEGLEKKKTKKNTMTNKEYDNIEK